MLTHQLAARAALASYAEDALEQKLPSMMLEDSEFNALWDALMFGVGDKIVYRFGSTIVYNGGYYMYELKCDGLLVIEFISKSKI